MMNMIRRTLDALDIVLQRQLIRFLFIAKGVIYYWRYCRLYDRCYPTELGRALSDANFYENLESAEI